MHTCLNIVTILLFVFSCKEECVDNKRFAFPLAVYFVNHREKGLTLQKQRERERDRERGGERKDRDKILGLMWVMELKDHLSVYMYSTV